MAASGAHQWAKQGAKQGAKQEEDRQDPPAVMRPAAGLPAMHRARWVPWELRMHPGGQRPAVDQAAEPTASVLFVTTTCCFVETKAATFTL